MCEIGKPLEITRRRAVQPSGALRRERRTTGEQPVTIDVPVTAETSVETVTVEKR